MSEFPARVCIHKLLFNLFKLYSFFSSLHLSLVVYTTLLVFLSILFFISFRIEYGFNTTMLVSYLDNMCVIM